LKPERSPVSSHPISPNFSSLLLVYGGFVVIEIEAEVVLFLDVELEYLLHLFLKAEFPSLTAAEQLWRSSVI
jgi:hypothetical protein